MVKKDEFLRENGEKENGSVRGQVSRSDFPPNFVFGVATSSYQVRDPMRTCIAVNADAVCKFRYITLFSMFVLFSALKLVCRIWRRFFFVWKCRCGRDLIFYPGCFSIWWFRFSCKFFDLGICCFVLVDGFLFLLVKLHCDPVLFENKSQVGHTI